eukprot:COSAG04_NODE_17327_length_472_cov_1.061662_1_plen_86_part_10
MDGAMDGAAAQQHGLARRLSFPQQQQGGRTPKMARTGDLEPRTGVKQEADESLSAEDAQAWLDALSAAEAGGGAAAAAAAGQGQAH